MKRLLFSILFVSTLFWPVWTCIATWPSGGRAEVPIVDGGSGSGIVAPDFTLDPNCVGAWYNNEDAGNSEVDRSGEGNTLAVTAADTIPTSATVPAGYGGASRDFESGEADALWKAVEGGVLDINGANAKVSKCAWVRLESVPGSGAFYGIISKYDGAANQRQYLLALSGTGSSQFKFVFVLSDDSTSGNAATQLDSTTTTYVGATWYHVCAVYDDIDMRIYVDGSLDSTPLAKTDGIFDGNSSFFVGSGDTGINPFDGLIDEPVVFNDALSSSEVSEIHVSGISGNKGGND